MSRGCSDQLRGQVRPLRPSEDPRGRPLPARLHVSRGECANVLGRSPAHKAYCAPGMALSPGVQCGLGDREVGPPQLLKGNRHQCGHAGRPGGIASEDRRHSRRILTAVACSACGWGRLSHRLHGQCGSCFLHKCSQIFARLVPICSRINKSWDLT